MGTEYQRETAALDTVVPLSPTAGSLADILSKAAGARTFDKATDSFEAIRDKIDTLATPVSTASATTTGVIVQDTADGTFVYNNVDSGAINTFGAWTQIDASASANSWIGAILVTFTATSTMGYIVEIGTGAAGSETTKIRFSWYALVATNVGYSPIISIPLPIPIKVASGTRIAARAAAVSAAQRVYIGLSMYQSLET